jgi:transposase
VAVLIAGQDTPLEWRIANEPQAIRKMLKRVAGLAAGDVRYCYEAGPCGYALQRQIISWSDASCMLVAPSLTPRKPGERVKTDRRDARKLAQLFRAGLLTEVQPLTEQDEAARDLSRAREDLREDLVRARHRLSKLLLRRAISFPGKHAWTLAHRRWLESLRFDNPLDAIVTADYLLAIDHIEQRLKSLLLHLDRLALDPRYAKTVATLRCFRSFDTITAVGLAVELHNFERFTAARRLMSFIGLIPGEHSSGEKRRQGAITKTGNSHVRRILVESAWCYRYSARLSRPVVERQLTQPKAVRDIAWRAQLRLCSRYRRLCGRGMHSNKICVAVARELAGFIWEAARYVQATIH